MATEFLDRDESARFLRVSVRTLDRLDIPKIHLTKRRVLYDRAALEAFAAARATNAMTAETEAQ